MYDFTLGCIIGLALGYQLGTILYDIRKALHSLQNTVHKEQAVIVSPHPEIRREQSPFVVEPKSPQLVAYEEDQELRKLNPGKF